MKAASSRTRTDLWLLAAVCGFLFFYGLGSFGLLGADEPRYAQVAREMLGRSDWVTPVLMGEVWLEKPVLYYWQAMLAFRVWGVSDPLARTARIPGAVDAAMLVAAIYFFLRRFRPGSELDGSLITASSVGIIGFAHAAATDMPLAATFGIALLGWYGWYESRQRIYLAAFYVFIALGTLAKGPVAPALAAVIIVLFVAARRDWRAILGTLWIPGIFLYLAVMLPWYVAVQLRNPEFFRVFILEHNLARFSQDVYHHRQPFWFYLPVFLLATMPWTVLLTAAIGKRIRSILSPGKGGRAIAENSWPLFLLIWMAVPVLFFSASKSKLPGYILPAVPAAALLVAEYLAARRESRSEGGKKISAALAIGHGVLCGILIFAALSAGSVATGHRFVWIHEMWGSAAWLAVSVVTALIISFVLLSRAGLQVVTRVTAFVVIASVFVVIQFAAPAIDATQSARPIAEGIESYSHEPVPVALYHLNRVQEYGLEFYLNRPALPYESGKVPDAAHVLIAAQGTLPQIEQFVPGRRVSYLSSIPAQKVDVYFVQEK
jgi:4-amino-4-deoxy-L-arabinose transferase-like glycosyltransferase